MNGILCGVLAVAVFIFFLWLSYKLSKFKLKSSMSNEELEERVLQKHPILKINDVDPLGDESEEDGLFLFNDPIFPEDLEEEDE
jgi:hypothetical protein